MLQLQRLGQLTGLSLYPIASSKFSGLDFHVQLFCYIVTNKRSPANVAGLSSNPALKSEFWSYGLTCATVVVHWEIKGLMWPSSTSHCIIHWKPVTTTLLLTQNRAGILYKDNFKFLKELICSGKYFFLKFNFASLSLDEFQSPNLINCKQIAIRSKNNQWRFLSHGLYKWCYREFQILHTLRLCLQFDMMKMDLK